MFDIEPDGDPHGECAQEIAKLRAENESLRRVADAAQDLNQSAVEMTGGSTDTLVLTADYLKLFRVLAAVPPRDEKGTK